MVQCFSFDICHLDILVNFSPKNLKIGPNCTRNKKFIQNFPDFLVKKKRKFALEKKHLSGPSILPNESSNFQIIRLGLPDSFFQKFNYFNKSCETWVTGTVVVDIFNFSAVVVDVVNPITKNKFGRKNYLGNLFRLEPNGTSYTSTGEFDDCAMCAYI